MQIEKVALMVTDFEDGGVERNFTNLAIGLARLGIDTSLFAGKPDHPYLRDLEGLPVRLFPVDQERSAHARWLLRQEQPDVLMTGKLPDDFAAVAARAGLGGRGAISTRLVAAVGTLLSGRSAAHPWNPIRRHREIARIRACYRKLDGITAISKGVADDLRAVFGIHETPIRVLNNPIIPDAVETLASAPCEHPWLRSIRPDTPLGQRPPVIIAVGGLRKVKNFDNLLRAFALLTDCDTRLLILGEGKERRGLAQLAKRLGIAERVDLFGFAPNPYPFIARSRVLALTSRREGLGNVVIEALAVGTPIVVTDCSHGLADLLDGRALGQMVPVGKPAALAQAISTELHLDRDMASLKVAVEPYRLLQAARAHLEFFSNLSP